MRNYFNTLKRVCQNPEESIELNSNNSQLHHFHISYKRYNYSQIEYSFTVLNYPDKYLPAKFCNYFLLKSIWPIEYQFSTKQRLSQYCLPTGFQGQLRIPIDKLIGN